MLNGKQSKIIENLRIELGFNYVNPPNPQGDYTAMILDLIQQWWNEQPESEEEND